MKVLHYYHKQDREVAQYVSVLVRAMAASADVAECHSLPQYRELLKSMQPEIVHIHGCWHFSYAMVSHLARVNGIRVVLSPHGQLEPWVIKQHYWKEKLPKLIAYQRRLVERAYTIVSMGRMEDGCLERLKWNPRHETVLNTLITDSITEEQMGMAMIRVYDKVLDSDQWPLMAENTTVAVVGFIKAGFTGDSHWLTNEEYEACKNLQNDELRKVVLYAYQEAISETVNKGFTVLGIERPDIEPSTVPCYYPKDYDPVSVVSLDNKGASDEERLLSMIHSAKQMTLHNKLSIHHMVELSTALRKSNTDEAKFAEILKKRHLFNYTSRLMQVAADMTGLEEGFMPVKGMSGRKTDNIENLITKHLEI